MTHNDILFISSDSKFDFDSFFDGYAFFQADLVIGNQGFQNYSKNNNNYQKYEDGNYILIDKINNNSYRLSRDYHGYYPLYHYEKDGYWCVSNSIVYIVEKLKEKGITVSFDGPNVEIWKCHLAFTQQLTSHNTFVDGVRVLPSNHDIIFLKSSNGSKIALSKREVYASSEMDYDVALKNCLDIWRQRYLTIISNKKIALKNDLTGGLDSRCLLSFLSVNVSQANYAEKDSRLKINSNPNHSKDFEISERLAKLVGLNLNVELDQKFQSKGISPEESFAVWKYFNVGRYSPIIFPSSDFNPKISEFGGEGGEDNREFYLQVTDKKYNSFNEFIEKRYKAYFSTNERFEKWAKQINLSISVLNQENSSIDSILHYREFRSVCHTIKQPKSQMKFAPLGSKYFNKLCQLSSKDALKSGQLIYDVIFNNNDKLLYIPFDSEDKGMSDKNVANLKTIDIDNRFEHGDIYISDINDNSNIDLLVPLPISIEDKDYISPLHILYEKSIKSLGKNEELAIYYYGSSYTEDFYKKLKDFEKNKLKNLGYFTKGYFMHALILLEVISNSKK